MAGEELDEQVIPAWVIDRSLVESFHRGAVVFQWWLHQVGWYSSLFQTYELILIDALTEATL